VGLAKVVGVCVYVGTWGVHNQKCVCLRFVFPFKCFLFGLLRREGLYVLLGDWILHLLLFVGKRLCWYINGYTEQTI
jgi:hypothetical protein